MTVFSTPLPLVVALIEVRVAVVVEEDQCAHDVTVVTFAGQLGLAWTRYVSSLLPPCVALFGEIVFPTSS